MSCLPGALLVSGLLWGSYSLFLDDCTLPSAPNTCITLEFLPFGSGSSMLCLRMAPLLSIPIAIKDMGEALVLNSSRKGLSTWSLQCLDLAKCLP